MAWQNPRTATPQKSIWLQTPEDDFRHHLVELESKTNSIPMDPQVFSPESSLTSSSRGPQESYTLPLQTEQQITDDFAFLAAVTEGAQSVAAVCLEERSSPPGLTLRFATLDSLLDSSIKEGLFGISEILMKNASESTLIVPTQQGESTQEEEPAQEEEPPQEKDPNPHLNSLLSHIITLHQTRLLARLRSAKWIKPTYLSKSHKSPLYKNFSTLHHRTQHLYSKSEKALLLQTQSLITSLCTLYTTFESTPPSATHGALKALISASYTFLSSPLIKIFSLRLQASQKAKKPTPQIASALKTLRQIEKIAACKRVCSSLLKISKEYGEIFRDIRMEYLRPYKSVETGVGYEEWARSMHVHAEVQLVVYYDLLNSSSSKILQGKEEKKNGEGEREETTPRCIGTSKLLCYLCYQFLKAHQMFFPSRTHGRLYDQWTIPDLGEYNEEIVGRYRGIVKEMDDVVVQASEGEGEFWRLMPMTSVDSGPFE
jgi:hypothetical protein